MNKVILKFIVIMLSVFIPSVSYSASIGKSPTVIPSSNCNSGLSCGLVGYWTFDGRDVVNGLVIDKSGNGNNANLSNIATSTFFVPGKIGQGFNFDGSNDALNAGSAAILDNMSAMTLSVWVKLNSYGAGGGGYLINKGDNNSGGHGWSLFLSQSNNLISFTARYNTTNLLVQTSASSFATSDLNKWVHIMVTWDGSSNAASGVHIYKNGNELAYSAQTNGSSSYLSDAADNLNIGDGGLISNRQTNGIIDDVRVYNRVLSTKELAQIYNLGASTKQSASMSGVATSTCSVGLSCGLVTYWTFDGKDIVNGVIKDNSSNGTFANIANISTSTFYTSGVKGQALRFDDNDDYIYSDLGTERSTFTLSFWYIPKNPNNWQNNQTGFHMGKTTYSDSNNFRWYSTGSNPKIQASSNNGGTSNLSTAYTLETRNPYLNTFVYTPTQIDWYINGVLFNSTTPSVSTFDPMRFIRIGGTGNANQSANGVIDDFRIYSKALTVGEIRQLYSSVISTKQSSSPVISTYTSCTSGLSCGLVGYWTFDGKDMLNGVPLDKSGNNKSAVLSGIATSTFFVPGKIGQGFNFDGVNNFATTSLQWSSSYTSLTIAFWFKTNQKGSYGAIMHNYPPTGSPTSVIETNIDTDNKFHAYIRDSAGNSVNPGSSGSVNDDKWHHGAVTFSNRTAILYLDGIQTSSATAGSFNGNMDPGQFFRIAKIADSSGEHFYKGGLDDLRIYNRELLSIEIFQLYSQGR